jgi:HEAT repeat protein
MGSFPSRISFARGKQSTRRLAFLCGLGVLCLFLAALLVMFASGKFDLADQSVDLGNRSLGWEVESNGQTKLLSYNSEKPKPAEGDFETKYEIRLRIPSGTLAVHYQQDPVPFIRKRLPTNITDLVKLLGSRDAAVIHCAAEALAETNATLALPALIEAAARTGEFYAAIEQISVRAPAAAVDPLIRGVKMPNAEVRRGCAEVLAELGTEASSSAEILRAAFDAEETYPHVFAYALLKVLNDFSYSLPKLCKLLKANADSSSMWGALWVLGEAGEKAEAALPEVIRLTTNSPPSLGIDLRPFALRAVSRISKNPEVVLPPILAALDAPMPDRLVLRTAAIQALGNIGPAGLKYLLSIYQGTNQQERLKAAQAMASMGPASAGALGILTGDLVSATPSRVALACQIIEKMGPSAVPAIAPLRNLLLVPNRSVRIRAASALIKLGEFKGPLVSILVEAIGEFSNHHSADLELALRTLSEVVKKNPAAKSELEELLRMNPKAAAYFHTNRDYVRILGAGAILTDE